MSARRLGLLHTVPTLAGTFTNLIRPALPGSSLLHIVDAELLATAISEGVTPDVRARVAAHISYLQAAGCRAVLVTCSSIGEAADEAARLVAIPVLRIDDQMGAEAVRIASADDGRGGGIAVLATLEATLGPSARLIQSKVRGRAIELTSLVVADAAAARAAGDFETHDRLIADAVALAAASADVIVLAQASMADAASRVDTPVPVLTSPAGGVAALVAVAAD